MLERTVRGTTAAIEAKLENLKDAKGLFYAQRVHIKKNYSKIGLVSIDFNRFELFCPSKGRSVPHSEASLLILGLFDRQSSSCTSENAISLE